MNKIERRDYLELNKDSIYKDYFINDISIKQISTYHKLEDYHISHFIKIKWGRKSISNSKQKYTIDLNLFEHIDCQWKNYFLGWMYSDGNIYTRSGKNTISLCIEEKDKYILDYFNNKIFNGEKPLNYRESRVKKGTDYVCKPLWRFQIDSVKICGDLISLGLIQNKSLTKTFPQWLDKNNMPHFIRGYFEGNGTIGTNNNKDSLRVRIFCGSENFITSMGKVLSDVLSTALKVSKINDTTFCLSFGKRDCISKFYSYIYNNCEMSLDRKKNKFVYKNNSIGNDNFKN